MRGFLGEKIGGGASADIHVWAPGQVVKLFKASGSEWFGRHEARMTRAAFAVGAPEVFDEVSVNGRFGIVLRRLDGPTLQQLLLTGAMTPGQAGAILASLYISVHKTPPPPEVPLLRRWIDHASQASREILPEHIATGVLALIDRLPPEDRLCHSDLHGGNVIMTADGPRLIDWGGAVRAPAALELAFCHVILSENAPEVVDNPRRPRAVNAAAQSEYARLAGISQTALTAAVEPYLPIARVWVLRSGAIPALREQLIQRIEAALRPQD